MRALELRGLAWEDVDFERNVVHVRMVVKVLKGNIEAAPGRMQQECNKCLEN